jgi:YD repeat-containing protein
MMPRSPIDRCLSGAAALLVFAGQIARPVTAEAAPLGSSTASAGSVPPPSITAVESFQPDLFTGRATLSLPVPVPPGRKGVQPALALSYSSSGRNGWLGAGWNLELGAIERSTKNGVPSYTDADTFTISFQGTASDLIKIPDGTYRLETEGLFLRVARAGAGWDVHDTSGTRYSFGKSVGAQIESGGKVFRWALDEVVDTNGNGMAISYAKDQGQLYPAQVTYTTTTITGGPTPVNQVLFALEDRADRETSYRATFPVTTAKRLRHIEARVVVGGTPRLARRIALGYTTSARTKRSLLSSVAHIGTDGATQLRPVTFTYDQTAPAYTIAANNPVATTPAWNVRVASLDVGHDNHGAVHPYAGIPWGAPQVVQGTRQIDCITAVAGANGSLSLSGCQDRYAHAWTWLYTVQPRQLSLPYAPMGCDSNGSLWQEDALGVVRITDGILRLQPGWSVLHVTDYHQHDCFSSQLSAAMATLVDRMAPSQFIEPRLAGDVDGNGITDLIAANLATGTWKVALSRGGAVSPETVWLNGFGDAASTPLLGDWDADTNTDIALYAAGQWRFATVNATGTGFQTGTMPPIAFGSGTPLVGDFNGDGRADLGTYSSGAWTIALASGASFTPSTAFAATHGSANHDPLTGDFNGDGLTDIGAVDRATGGVALRLSTGTGFAPSSTAIATFGAGQPHLAADINGDGLTDVAIYNRSTGQLDYALGTGTQFTDDPGTVLPATFTQTAADDVVQVADFNGDGLLDPAVFNPTSGASQIGRSRGGFIDLLVRVDNGVGGSTSIVYHASSLCDNVCPIERVPKLPFVLPLAGAITVNNGMGRTITTTYHYMKGRYDAAAREFRGFARVEVRDPEGHATVTEFHQDPHTRGRPFHTERRDADGRLWTASDQTWSCVEPYPNVHFVTLDRTVSSVCDGDATCKSTAVRLTYDVYGNVTRTDDEGDVDAPGLERSVLTSYAVNAPAWILSRPQLVQTLDAQGAVISQRRFYYDGATSTATAPIKGNLTREEAWRNLPTVAWLPTRLAYDAYGNLTQVTDAIGRVTRSTYDSTSTLLTTIANHLGHMRTISYDPVLSTVLQSKDANNVVTTTQYDVLGRVTAVIGPTDSAAQPTVRYEYPPCLTSGGCTLPLRSGVHARIASGQSAELSTYAFTDGLGRTLQTRSPAESSVKQVVGGMVELDARGLVTTQWPAYLEDASTTYRPLPSTVAAPVRYAYDPMGRVVQAIGPPNDATTTTTYADWSVALTNANGQQVRRTHDASGRPAKVEEFAAGQVYATTYTYHPLGSLAQVTDAAGNVTRISYDSLGRKLAMDDPDMGHWEYAYDDVDNLASQKDARGVTTSFTYDGLNRVTQKAYQTSVDPVINPGPVTYIYDASTPTQSFSKGKLVRIVDGVGSSDFVYDTLGRLVTERRTMDGTTHTIQRNYDLLGRLMALTYPDAEVARYTYNAQGGIDTVTLDSPSSGLTRLVTNMDYNAAGQVTNLRYDNGVTTTYTYDADSHRLSTLASTGPAGALQSFGYTFDALGNITQIQDNRYTGTQTLGYDPLNRLTQAAGAYGSVTYRYDPIGNLLEKEGVAMAYGGVGGSKPHAVTSMTPPGSAPIALRYDANGNLIEKPTAESPLLLHTFKYDVESRLTEAATPQDERVPITFAAGWNFFSLPVIPSAPSITQAFPAFGADFSQLTRYDAGVYKHYVGNSKFDDFSTLEYGVGYQIYCKNPSGAAVEFSGRVPSKSLTKALATGWHLLSGIMLQPASIGTVFSTVDQSAVKGYDTATRALTTATQTAAARAYYVNVRTTSTWTPPLPKDVTTRFAYDGDGGRVRQTTAAGATTFLGQVYEIAPGGATTKYVFAGSQRIAAIETSPAQASIGDAPARLWAVWWRNLLDALVCWLR